MMSDDTVEHPHSHDERRPHADGSDPLIGRQIGTYKVTSRLGAGGAGEVYRAIDTNLRRPVAIKLLSERVADAAMRRRFQSEARTASSLNHPHIVTVHDAGEFEGRQYLVTEFVDGGTLRDWARAAARDPQAIVDLLLGVGDALATAHDRGIVHRDVKPDNILVSTEGYAKLADFGLAKLFEHSAAAAHTTMIGAETQTGVVMGTVGYMSPEQAAGRGVDARTDMFSFGVVLYELLSGRRPFAANTALDELHAIVHRPEAPLPGAVPGALQRVVTRALAKNPADRYDTMRDMVAELRSVARHTAAVRESRRWPRARVVVGLVALVAVGASLVGWWSYRQAARRAWVEQSAVPEIARLIETNRALAALTLYQRAEQYAPESRSLFRLAEGVAAGPKTFETTPPGARIYISDYSAAAGDDVSDWQLVGDAPVTTNQIPDHGYYRVRAVKAGFAAADLVAGPVLARPAVIRITLHADGTVPSGMVSVPATQATTTVPPLSLPPFWIDRYEITNQQFKEFVDAGGYQRPEYWQHPFVKNGQTLSWQQAMAEFRDLTGRPGPATWQLGAYAEGAGDLPVGGVSWYEAEAYAAFAGKSLPTVYEWNHAAGAPAGTSNILQLSNFAGKAPSVRDAHRGMAPFGTFDMAGNLKEWTWNATGAARYVLGGAWDESPYTFSMADARMPFDRDDTLGFRCVRRPTAPPPGSFAEITVPRRRNLAREKEPVADDTYRHFAQLHAYDHKAELDAMPGPSDESSPYWRRQTISVRAAYGDERERVILHLFLPKNTPPPYQVVAVMGGSTITTLRSVDDFNYPFQFLIRSGRAVLIPAFRGTLERGPSPGRLPAANQERERALDWSMDLGRSIDYLESRSDIDTKKLGFYGLSLGAAHGVRMIAVDRRFQAAVFSAGGLLQIQPPETDAWNFAPRVRTPVLMVNGRDDFQFQVETNQKPLFQALGTPDKRHILYDGGHGNLVTRPDLIGEILNWFDRYLGPVPARDVN
jgi:dienelactone hydrolase